MTTDLFRRYGNLLRSDGTNQLQRLLPGLESDYIVPDERSLSELIEYARRVAAEIRFYDLSGHTTGDWTPFFDALLVPGTDRIRPTEELQVLLASRADWPPHLVLFLVFLKLFQFLQSDLNQLTEKHLLHYYEKELGLLHGAAVSDDVHVIFELAQNAAATMLPAGTLLDAGKDEQGRALLYATQSEVVVSTASVSGIRRLVKDHDKHLNRRFFVADGFTELEGARGGHTFGRRQLDLDPSQRFMTEAPLGFAVAAPILHLAEGERQVTLLAHLRLPPPSPGSPPGPPPAMVSQNVTSGLEVALTGAEGWLVPESFEAQLLADGGLGQPALSLTLTLSATAAAVIAFDSALHGDGLVSARAVLRCLVKGESGLYDLLDGVIVDKIELTVDVKGLRNFVVQNDDGPLESTKPMPIFGAQPRLGSVFYIGSAEVFSKRLTDLALTLEWKSPPDNLFAHYRAYFDSVNNTLSDAFSNLFRFDVHLLYDRSFRRLLFNQALFEPVTSQPHRVFALPSIFNAALAGLDYEEQPDLEVPETFSPTSRYGFLRLELVEPTRNALATYATAVPFEAFGHSSFVRRYAHQAIALSTWKPADGPKPLLPSEPYTPVLNSLTLDYRAKADLTPADGHADAAYFVIGPFGATRARESSDACLVPDIEGEAALFLGIAHFQAPANLSLFFEVEVGTGTAATVLEPGDVEWSYLGAEDAWQTLNPAAVLIDSTQGFQKSGLIALAVPRDAVTVHESLPSELLWLRALIRRAPESAARTLAVKTHAALARFQPGSLPLQDFDRHLQSGLPAATISRLAQRNANIREIEQPNPSFGGRSAEGSADFFRRSSERLRHRNRAVTAWDFERLVLERFPEVFKVKCLPHTDAGGAFKAGSTAVVIVPNLRRTGSSNVLEPRAGEVLLGEIKQYLAPLTSAFATLHVIRPVFERIRVETKVVFARGRDPGYYAGVLNDELRRFLSPWAYQEGEDILFGARIYRSEILAFVEGRDYVDHLVGLRLYHSFEGVRREGIGWMTIDLDFIVHPTPRPGIAEMRIDDDFVVGRPVEVAETTQAHAILVSHPEHLITPVAAGAEICAGVTQLGIGYMTVALDFEIETELIA